MDVLINYLRKYGFWALAAYAFLRFIYYLGRIATGNVLMGIGFFIIMVLESAFIGLLIFAKIKKKDNFCALLGGLMVVYMGVGNYFNAFNELTAFMPQWAYVIRSILQMIGGAAIAFVFVLYILKVLFNKELISKFIPLILIGAICLYLLSAIFYYIYIIIAGMPFYAYFVPFATPLLYIGIYGFAYDVLDKTFGFGSSEKSEKTEEKTEETKAAEEKPAE